MAFPNVKMKYSSLTTKGVKSAVCSLQMFLPFPFHLFEFENPQLRVKQQVHHGAY